VGHAAQGSNDQRRPNALLDPSEGEEKSLGGGSGVTGTSTPASLDGGTSEEVCPAGWSPCCSGLVEKSDPAVWSAGVEKPSGACAEPSLGAKELSVAAEEPSGACAEPSLGAKELSVVAEEPSGACAEPSLGAKELSVAAEEPSGACAEPSLGGGAEPSDGTKELSDDAPWSGAGWPLVPSPLVPSVEVVPESWDVVGSGTDCGVDSYPGVASEIAAARSEGAV
jgi:hypothetical protein